MSKLFVEYIKLKKQNAEKLYLFKSGIFYIALDEDAVTLSNIFNFKLTNLNDSTQKCGFPMARLEYYISELQARKIPFDIVDLNYSKIDNYSDYLNNQKLKKIVSSILELDMNNTTFKQSFDILNTIKNDLETIYPSS